MESIIGLGALHKRLDAISSETGKRRYLGRLGLSVVSEAKHRVARKTGNTGRTIKLGEVTSESVTVEASGAAVYLEHGTRPHIIRPRRGKALRFAVGSANRRLTGTPRNGAPVVFARFVRHPGTKAQPFLRPSVEVVMARELERAVIDAWDGAA